ncbi:MAG: DUF1592/DUF1588/PA14 domain-containing protein/DUF1595/Cytochrome C oxidase, cbb3-type, subunit III [Verrucomicrobia bacterium]|nr:MAG: DUF1592/DUF1588/PA14 domain-containing protein/DUF1595/Cytochrome C oxidase, cbb3-type, subunit III [Verrucomicrobiota bacterium]
MINVGLDESVAEFHGHKGYAGSAVPEQEISAKIFNAPPPGVVPIWAMAWKTIILLVLAAGAAPLAGHGAERGEVIYRKLCAECHGAAGEGVDGKADDPLHGKLSLPALAAKIERTMPEDNVGACVGEEAQAVARYIYDAFYSPAARLKGRPVRQEMARLTVPQFRNSVADLVASFRGNAGQIPGPERGLTGQYFGRRGFSGDKELQGKDKFKRVDPAIQFDFGTGLPSLPEGVSFPAQDEFSVRWEGGLIAPTTGEYEFVLETRNGAMLWVNNHEWEGGHLIDALVAGSNEVRKASGRVALIGGRVYPIRLEFFKYKEVHALIRLFWKRPDGVLEPVPARMLTPHWTHETLALKTPFPADDRSAGYERGNAVSREWLEALTDAAIEAADSVIGHVNELARVKKEDAPEVRREKIRTFAKEFVERAWRREFSEAEREQFLDRRLPKDAPLEASLKRFVIYTLTSPQFLYPEAVAPEGDWAVASRLALALWDSIPDQRLREAARKHQLSTREQVAKEAWRMLSDARARAKLGGFFEHWLELDRAAQVSKDPKRFPEFSPAILADLRTSLDLFVEEVVWGESSDYRRLLLDDGLYLNHRLAAVYGVPNAVPAGGDEFRRVALPAQGRAGLVTHPYLLTSFAYHDNTSPIHRGVFLTRHIVGMRLKPPPEAIKFEDGRFDPNLTMREKVTELTRSQSCMGCHATINPLGFSLEHFDSIGRWRAQEKGKPIQAAGEFIDANGAAVKLSGARDLAVYAADSPSAHASFIAQLFDHLAKQPVESYGPGTADRLLAAFTGSGFKIRNLLVEIAVIQSLASTVPSSLTATR